MTNQLDHEPINLIYTNGPTRPLSHTWETYGLLKINATCWEMPLSYPSRVPFLTPMASWEPFSPVIHRPLSSGFCPAFSIEMLQDLGRCLQSGKTRRGWAKLSEPMMTESKRRNLMVTGLLPCHFLNFHSIKTFHQPVLWGRDHYAYLQMKNLRILLKKFAQDHNYS